MRRGLYRLNSTVLSCRLNALNCISSRRSAGKLFHTRGPATEKLRTFHGGLRWRRWVLTTVRFALLHLSIWIDTQVNHNGVEFAYPS